MNQPSQARRVTRVVAFRVPQHEAEALQRLADDRNIKLGRLLRAHLAPLAALAPALDE